MMVEGAIEAEDYEILEAWQFLIDTGTVWTLQGFYGRTARALIEQGLCYLPNAEEVFA
jgi:hypothetical protein